MDSKIMERLGPYCFGRREKRLASRIIRLARLKSGSLIYTGNGKLNRVVAVDKEEISVVTRENGPVIPFKIDRLVNAAAYFYRVRMIERKELEQYHKFSSCLFGILRLLFKQRARVYKKEGLLRLVLNGLRFFFAGAEKCRRDIRLAVEAGAKYVLMSYFWLRRQRNWRILLDKLGLKMLLDSGAFSVWMAVNKRKKVEGINIHDYISFINRHKDMIEGAIVLDVVGDEEATRENLRLMEELCEVPPIPVFHMGSPVEELRKLVDSGRYPLIALGGTVNKGKRERYEFFKRVFSEFPSFPFHGLGISDVQLLLDFPFFSCDSSVWQQSRRKNIWITRAGQKKGPADAPLRERLKAMCSVVGFLSGLEDPDVLRKVRRLPMEQLRLSL